MPKRASNRRVRINPGKGKNDAERRHREAMVSQILASLLVRSKEKPENLARVAEELVSQSICKDHE